MSALVSKSTLWFSCIILALLLVIGAMYFRLSSAPASYLTIVRDTIAGDSIPYSVDLPKPYPVIVYQDTGQPYWKFRKVDTAAILAEHYYVNVYSDTLKDDTSALVVVIDTVKWNVLQRRGLVFQNRRATVINNILPPIRDGTSLLLGVGIGRSPNEFGLMPIAGLLTKQGSFYSVGYDLIQRDIYVTALWKIHRSIKIP